MTKASCYGCEKRTKLCHNTCEDYKKYRQDLDTRKENERLFKEKYALIGKRR